MEFNLYTPGTRVIYIGDPRGFTPLAKGDKGTIVTVEKGAWGRSDGCTYDLGIDWDKASNCKHDCSGAARPDHGWWVYEKDVTFEPKKEPKKKRRKDS